jgi:uncharacterized membrane protein HdeD (DUF308 family)
MLAAIADHWYALALRGGVGIAAGIAALLAPVPATRVLLISYLVADGLFALMIAFCSGLPRRSRVFFAADGLADLVVAVVLLTAVEGGPMMTVVVAFWAIGTGIFEIAAAALTPRMPGFAWTVAAIGLISLCVGIVLMDRTDFVIVSVLYLFGAYAVLTGVLFLALGIVLVRLLVARLRRA